MESSSWILLAVSITTVLSADGVYFQTYPGTRSYRDAIIFCHNHGMRLPLIKSPFDQSLVLAALPLNPKFEYWIGLNYRQDLHRHAWRDNSSLCWQNWIVSSSNEPNKIELEQCVVMRGYGLNKGTWLTKTCSINFGTICQALPRDRQGNMYNQMHNKVPSVLPIKTLPVWTKISCLVLCNLIGDCLMITYDGTSRLCNVHDCRGNLTDSPMSNVWVKQSE